MSTTVGTLVSELRGRSSTINTRLRNVELIAEGDHAGFLRVDDQYLPWGDRTTQLFTAFVGGPQYKYYGHEPLEWQRQVVHHHTRQLADQEVIVHIEGNNVAGIYDPGAKPLPLVLVAERVQNVFDDDDHVTVRYAPDEVEIEVISDFQAVTVPGREGVADRPGLGEVDHPYKPNFKIGDMSAGGVRIRVQPGRPERAPTIEEVWFRYFCLNGMTRRVAGAEVRLRGLTRDEILLSMENSMRLIYEGLSASARAIHHSANTPIVGGVSDFIRQVATERGVSAQTVIRLQELAAALPEDPSVYDVTQVITGLANGENMPVAGRRRLQALGGDLTIDTQRMIHRCITCARPLPE